MNKEIFDQLPVDEQTVASKLNATAEHMKIPQVFQWKLESQLMDAYKNNSKPKTNRFSKYITAAAWITAAALGLFLFAWTINSLSQNSGAGTAVTEIPFDANVRQGGICAGPLAVAHNFSVALTNSGKTEFITLDPTQSIGELRSFAWSPNGKQLAVVGNTTGSGNIYLTDSTGTSLQPVLANSELGYLMGVAWSHDGKQLITWSLENNTVAYLMNIDGSSLSEIQLNMQIFATPQFTPDNTGIIFYGADSSSSGLFEYSLDGSQTRLISSQVEDESGFAWSSDASRLAYVEMDRESGEANLIVNEFTSGIKTILATLPIPKGSGSTIPEVANLNWSQDGSKLVFEFGKAASDRAIYLAYTDERDFIKVVDSAYAPTISADGMCLAYIKDRQVFLINISAISIGQISPAPLLVSDLPAGRSNGGFKMDMLQWNP